MALIKCKDCDTEMSKKAKVCPQCGAPAKKKTSIVTWMIVGFFALIVFGVVMDDSKPVDINAYPVSQATYTQINNDVGCHSKHSDDKKEDIFKSKYENHWMVWSGRIELVDNDSAQINIDGQGTQDLSVDFADKKAGYNLKKGQHIKVRFLMYIAGGCFLPFSGKHAVVL